VTQILALHWLNIRRTPASVDSCWHLQGDSPLSGPVAHAFILMTRRPFSAAYQQVLHLPAMQPLFQLSLHAIGTILLLPSAPNVKLDLSVMPLGAHSYHSIHRCSSIIHGGAYEGRRVVPSILFLRIFISFGI
jgi:hypothetical protein